MSAQQEQDHLHPSAAVISFSPLHMDARVRRQIHVLKSSFRVTAIGLSDPEMEHVHFVDISADHSGVRKLCVEACEKLLRAVLLKLRFFDAVYRLHGPVRRARRSLEDHDFKLIVANDIGTLPLALSLSGRAKVLFDAHEYAPRQFETWYLWKFFMRDYTEYLCRTSIPHVDGMTTVGPRIAEEYSREFGVVPSVVLSAPRHRSGRYTPHDGDLIRMVHVGAAARYRRLETIIETMTRLDDRFRLDFMLVLGNASYLGKLQRLASTDSRVRFIPPVSPDEIVEAISAYDVGICAYAPHSFNAQYALPNKFFDCLQARLCIAIGPLPEMQKLVERFHCGVVADEYTPAALAGTLSRLDRKKIEFCRQAADVAAAELSYERSSEALERTVRQMIRIRHGSKER